MAYYLTIKQGKTYHHLDLTPLKEFTKKSNLKSGSYTLEEIDTCLMQYENAYHFRKTLYESGIITLEDITKEITIRRKHNGTLVRVRYNLPYKDAAPYFDIMNLKYILISKTNDRPFIIKLIAYYRNSYINNYNISQIKYALTIKDDTLLSKALEEFYLKEVTTVNPKTGEVKINYKSYHDLAMFTYTYDEESYQRATNQTKEEVSLKQKATLEYLKEELKTTTPSHQPKPKTLKKELEGQISLFSK